MMNALVIAIPSEIGNAGHQIPPIPKPITATKICSVLFDVMSVPRAKVNTSVASKKSIATNNERWPVRRTMS